MNLGQKDMNKNLLTVWKQLFAMPKPKRLECYIFDRFHCRKKDQADEIRACRLRGDGYFYDSVKGCNKVDSYIQAALCQNKGDHWRWSKKKCIFDPKN